MSGQRQIIFSDIGTTAVVDVGANVGQYGRELRLSGFSGRIHSFEPAGEPFMELLKVSASDPAWIVHQVAFAAEAGATDFHTWGGSLSAIGSLRQPTAELTATYGTPRVERVEVRRLDDWLREQQLDLPRAHLKIDVQGGEADVLAGAGDMLSSFASLEFEAPLRELYAGEASLDVLLKFAREAGFAPVSIMTERFVGAAGAVDVDVLLVKR